MQKIYTLSFNTAAAFFLAMSMAYSILAEEKVIQQKPISFEKCLEVIVTSEIKLSIIPEIENVSEQKRVAVFDLADGSLTISCDGVKGTVTVSTNIE